MADVEAKETKVVSTPEKKVVEEKEVATKETPTKDIKEPEPAVEDVDENSKASENGDKVKENGVTQGKDVDEKESESNGSSANGDSTNGDAKSDEATETCCIKRKSTGGDVTDDAKEVTSPKKAKLDEKPAPVEVETNGS